MKSGVAQEHIRSALRTELHRNFGRIGEIEQGLGRAEGYLGKFCRGEISIPMDSLLKSIELLGADPGHFFCQALGTPVGPNAYLRDLMASEPEKGLANLQRTAAEIAMGTEAVDTSDLSGVIENPVIEEPGPQVLKLVETVMTCSGIEQRRRLRTAKRYRSVAFVDTYLQRLMRACYNDPKATAKLVEVVGVDLIPRLTKASSREKLELILRVMGIWAFARRCADSFEQAATSVYFALSLSVSLRFDKLTAELLRYGAYILSDNGRFQEALRLLGESLVIYDELDEPRESAKVLVQRGSNYLDAGDTLSAARALRKALRKMPAKDDSLRLYRLAAYQSLARAYETAGDLSVAEEWLEKAVGCFQQDGNINRAKLVWHAGRLAQKRGELDLAESRLREAQTTFVACEAGETTLVALDLTRVLLEQHKSREAVDLARGMACLIESSRRSPIDRAALVEFVRAAIEGQLTLAFVERLERSARGELAQSQ